MKLGENVQGSQDLLLMGYFNTPNLVLHFEHGVWKIYSGSINRQRYIESLNSYVSWFYQTSDIDKWKIGNEEQVIILK